MARKLLLADDSITIQKVVELVLAEEDFEIRSVSNGEDALNVIGSFGPDIVLADIEMPKVNGYQLCDRIKKNQSTSHIPVILLAGAFEPIDEDLARNVGADDSVIKPFESQELISKINAALTMSGAEVLEAVADEGELAAEEVFEISEEPAEAMAVGEEVSIAEAEEDLWAMEDMPEVVAEEGIEAFAEEAAAEDVFEIQEEPAAIPEPEPVFAASASAPAQPAAREFVMPEIAVPSKQEMMAVFEKSVRESVDAFISSMDLKELLLASLAPAMKESVEKVLWEIAPELAEKMMKEILKGSIASLTSEVEKVIWDTVPDLASSMISKEIEKIRSEF